MSASRMTTNEKSPQETTRYFTLHKYKLPQVQAAYKAFKQARRGIIYAEKAYHNYKKIKETETVQVTKE